MGRARHGWRPTTMVDHVSVGVSDIGEARKFYDKLLLTIGARCLADGTAFARYGRMRTEFLLLRPFDGAAPSAGNGTHVGFAAPSRGAVDLFHRTGLELGGSDEGAPGVRSAYPMENVYAAYVRDPFGNKLEAVHNGFLHNE